MNATPLAFWGLAVLAVLAGWRVFRTDSMVRASFLLLASFVAVGLIMLLLGAAYLGFATIFMMAVEMLVMALFMVMFMMNPAGLNPMQMVHQHAFAIAAGGTVFAALAALAVLADFPRRPLPANDEVIAALGSELLGDSMLIFESAGITLLATMVCSVVLATRSGRFGAADAASEPPGLVPGGAPAGGRAESAEGDRP